MAYSWILKEDNLLKYLDQGYKKALKEPVDELVQNLVLLHRGRRWYMVNPTARLTNLLIPKPFTVI